MKGIAAAIVLMWMTTASAAEIRCQDAPGREQNGVFWSWREIEGKRCWFVRAGSAMPPKSAFTWAKEEPIQEDVPAVPDKAKTGPSIQMLRVKPVTPEEMFEVRAKWLKDDR
jgi:hypothetical protein